MKVDTVQSIEFSEGIERLDASFYVNDGRAAKKRMKFCPYEVVTIKEVSKEVFIGGRFKRTLVEKPEYGIPLWGISDILKSSPDDGKLISKKNTENLEDLIVKPGWTLIARSGSGVIGTAAYANKNYEARVISEHVMRVIPDPKNVKPGLLFAYLCSRHGYNLISLGIYGTAIPAVEPSYVETIPIPRFPEAFQSKIHGLVSEAARLRVEGNGLLQEAREQLLEAANLPPLRQDEYEYFGSHAAGRELSVFTVKDLDPVSIAAFNYSARIAKIIQRVKDRNRTVSLYDSLSPSKIFSTGSFKRLECPHENGIRLVNQSDIFDYKIKGKNLYKRFVKNQDLVEYGEVLIAGVGTLGENETFCRVIFAGEDLTGRLVSGEFSRMKTCQEIPSGYLYAWLSTDYGFRMIRSTQAGTKLCRPILKLLYEIPVPVLSEKVMFEIDEKVREAHTKRYEGLTKETKAITILENEISSWQPSKQPYTATLR